MSPLKKRGPLYSNAFYRTEGGRWFTSSLVTVAIIVAIYLRFKPVFKTIDDARLMYVYAGYVTGKPVSNYTFSYIPLGWVLARLYMILPRINWYFLYHMGLIVLGSTLIGKTIYKICYRKHYPMLIAILIHIVLYVILCLSSTMMIHFEITSTIISTGGLVLFLGIDSRYDSFRKTIFEIILSAVCVALSYIICFNTFYSILCYVLAVVVYYILRGINTKKLKKALIYTGAFLLCIIVLTVSTKMAENHAKKVAGWEDYYKYNKYRVSFWDYPHSSYSENPELYEKAGWTKRFYDLAMQMYFMDSRFNIDALSTVVKRYSWFGLVNTSQMVKNAREVIEKLYRDYKIVGFATSVYGVLFVYLIVSLCLKLHWKRRWPEIVTAICCLLGTTAIVIFLASRGRLPLRAWLSCAIPCGMVCAVLVLKISKKPRILRSNAIRWGCGILSVALLCAGANVEYNNACSIERGRMVYRRDSSNIVKTLNEYAIAHPENIYIYDLHGAQNYDVFTMYPNKNKRPTNAIVWGSSYLFTPTYYEQLALNGRKRLLTENLFENDVYYITDPSKKYLKLLCDMLQESYPGTRCMKVTTLSNNLCVYKFIHIRANHERVPN